MLRTSLAACAFLLFIGATSIYSTVPNSVNYQGRLTDATGAPVPDGSILVKFTIYDAATAGTALWNSGFQSVTTTDGLFNYDLGSIVPLPDLFSTNSIRYLGISVNTDPEISPRTRFTSSGYSYQSQKSELALNADSLGGLQPAFYLDWVNMSNIPAGFADGVDDTASAIDWTAVTNIPAGFADGVDDVGIDQATADGRYLLETGDTLKGNLEFDTNNDGITNGGIKSATTGTNLELADNGNLKAKLWGQSFGEVDLVDASNRLTAFFSAGVNGGQVSLRNNAGASTITLRGNPSGDASVILPNDAINSTEMLDEPGITADLNSNVFITLSQTPFAMIDLATTTITIPTSGYIYVQGHTLHIGSGTTGRNVGEYQIDEFAGGGELVQYYTWAGFNVAPNMSSIYQSVEANRVYFKSAGTYTFRLEALTHSGNATNAITQCYGSKIIAMFFPTSYGSIQTLSEQPGDNPTAKAVSVTGLDGTVTTSYEMDLRYYEEKARAAKLAKQKAELAEAKAEFELTRARATAEQK